MELKEFRRWIPQDDNWKIPDWVEEDAAKKKQKGKSIGSKNPKRTKTQKNSQSTRSTVSISTVINTYSTDNKKEKALISVKERNKTKHEGDRQTSTKRAKEIPKQKETPKKTKRNLKKFADLSRSKEVNEVIDGMQQRCNIVEQKVVLDY